MMKLTDFYYDLPQELIAQDSSSEEKGRLYMGDSGKTGQKV